MKKYEGQSKTINSGKILRVNRATLLKLKAFVDREILEKSGQLDIFGDKSQGDIFKSLGLGYIEHAVKSLTEIGEILEFMLEENLETLRVVQSESETELRKSDQPTSKNQIAK